MDFAKFLTAIYPSRIHSLISYISVIRRIIHSAIGPLFGEATVDQGFWESLFLPPSCATFDYHTWSLRPDEFQPVLHDSSSRDAKCTRTELHVRGSRPGISRKRGVRGEVEQGPLRDNAASRKVSSRRVATDDDDLRDIVGIMIPRRYGSASRNWDVGGARATSRHLLQDFPD